MATEKVLRVGLVGYAFMGAAHSYAWRNAPRVFDLDAEVRMAAICGRDADATAGAADRYGWETTETDWRRLVERDDIDVVDVCTPGDSHAEIAVAALGTGKHVFCEKPLANSVAEAEAMTKAAETARAHGVRSMVGFNYRRTPAVALARELVAEGRIGEIRHARATYLQDWIVDPETPLSWRLVRAKAGSGALGDIGSHIVDASQFVTGDHLVGVAALTQTFVGERPLPSGDAGVFLGGQRGSDLGAVTVDDAALFIGRFSKGALGSFEATRMAPGRKNAMRIEVNGSEGSLAFDFEAMNELLVFDRADDPRSAGFRRVLATEPNHPYVKGWWPPGHGLGYDHTFIHEVADFVRAVAGGNDPSPSFEDGLGVQRVLAAVEKSAADESRWTPIGAG